MSSLKVVAAGATPPLESVASGLQAYSATPAPPVCCPDSKGPSHIATSPLAARGI